MHIERFFVPGLAHASYVVSSGREAVVIDRIQRPHLAGFIKRDELIFPRELAPHLEIHKGIRFPLIGARVLTKGFLVHGAHGGRSLRRRPRRLQTE